MCVTRHVSPGSDGTVTKDGNTSKINVLRNARDVLSACAHISLRICAIEQSRARPVFFVSGVVAAACKDEPTTAQAHRLQAMSTSGGNLRLVA
mmetsp:Transcript_1191/g.2792  ORF Transcript_1191/g.2792 Transcript_1191/m.2792 type:complete len:93 (-) Transcript_1191:756-1034(-)